MYGPQAVTLAALFGTVMKEMHEITSRSNGLQQEPICHASWFLEALIRERKFEFLE
jgi:hypothetical protein